MKKFLALLLSLVMVLALVACGDKKDDTNTDDQDNNEVTDFKVGFIMLHDENSTYDLNFINAAKEACETLGVEYTIVTNVPEGQECYDKAAELADAGCNIIFADSFGHEDYMIQAAKDFPDVQFCHSTGTKAHTEGLSNYHNAFASIYEGRYLAGIAAGMKLNEMIANGEFTADEAKIGYVGAFTYAEVISGYTSFFLGARSVCPTATMEVTFTGSWYDETAEKEGANKLIANNCVVLHNFRYIMEYSMYKTFAGKYRSTVRKINKKYRLSKLFTVKYEQKGVIKSRTFYKTSFKRRTTAFNGSCDIEPYSIADVSRTNLTDRLKAEKCELCGATGKLIMHHVRNLKDLKGKESWKRLMSARKRKTIALCPSCHRLRHLGKV